MAPERLGKILNAYLKRAGLRQKVSEQRILELWEGMVGDAIAQLTQPVRMRNGVLQVKVVNSVWMQELQFHKKLIMEKLNKNTGNTKVHDIWFFIGEKEGGEEGPSQDGKKKEEGQKRALKQEEKARIERMVSQLRDRELKEVFLSLFSKGLISGKADRKKD